MPLSRTHKANTRQRIVACARGLFNRHGFDQVSIDDIMSAAGLTRGGFYNHFKTKGELYAAALEDYASQREVYAALDKDPMLARHIFDHYASMTHVQDPDTQCPLMAVPSDVARSDPDVKTAYKRILMALVAVFERARPSNQGNQANQALSARQQALVLAATCVGASVLARTLDDKVLGEALCTAAREHAAKTIGW